ncbi:cellulose synthase complex periplasmic endoglucanase BcsZ [Caldimonas tepidiphila]|uniref:cellulose synthase complex periplasmic endoglucanase BcsZ n=1 Tax=Caldimonas tepidiphila TaxID=2315841 RepID=UPI000E5AA3C7|nr:cellulose synthase complex periplasmic endoglucanase BcsZ [Caldimonas tepidiphila]
MKAPARPAPPRRRMLRLAGALPLTLLLPPRVQAEPRPWPMWQRFVQRFVQDDGRVVDHDTAEKHSTSEGQSYAMFFALLAGDRALFERLWQWSLANLCPGGLARQLPAWRWGRRPDGSWGVLDANAAADADMWFAYALLEAHRRWGEARHLADAELLLDHVERSEIANLPGFGAMVLPGPAGFTPDADTWRLNPSYLPLPLLRRFAQHRPSGPWAEIARNTPRLIGAAAPRGFAPDWIAYRRGSGFQRDPLHPDLGSYDAIRVYLWAGLTAAADPLARPLLRSLDGMRQALRRDGVPPERVDVASGGVAGRAPAGFHAAVLPFLHACGETALHARVLALLDPAQGPLREQPAQPWPYYDQMLALFGLGATQGRYRFGADGRLQGLRR